MAEHNAVTRHGRPVAILGHSFGGQLVGLIDEARESAGAIFVGAQLGYYGYWPLLQRARLAVTWPERHRNGPRSPSAPMP